MSVPRRIYVQAVRVELHGAIELWPGRRRQASESSPRCCNCRRQSSRFQSLSGRSPTSRHAMPRTSQPSTSTRTRGSARRSACTAARAAPPGIWLNTLQIAIFQDSWSDLHSFTVDVQSRVRHRLIMPLAPMTAVGCRCNCGHHNCCAPA